VRPRGSFARLPSAFKLAATDGRRTIHIRSDSASHQAQVTKQQYGWVYNDDDLANLSLSIVDVLPRSSWDEDRALIMSTADMDPPIPVSSFKGQLFRPSGDTQTSPGHDAVHIRLGYKYDGFEDFLLSLWFKRLWNDGLEPAYTIRMVSRATRDVKLPLFTRWPVAGSPGSEGKQAAAFNGQLNLAFSFSRIEGRPFYTMSPRAVRPNASTSADSGRAADHAALEGLGTLGNTAALDDALALNHAAARNLETLSLALKASRERTGGGGSSSSKPSGS